jgi:hypothetical protein
MAEILFDNFDPKPAVQKNAENAHDWEYNEEAVYLYGMAVLFRGRFLDPVLRTDRGRLPDPIISFDDMRNRKVLAGYTLHRNPQGLLDEITFNTAHFQKKTADSPPAWGYGRWAQLETLLHEQVHLWQENFGQHKHKPGRVAHDKEFVAKCESLGLHPMPVIGCHHWVADGLFAQLMAELGIPRPSDVPRESNKPGKKDWFRPGPERGRSSLAKWECGCGQKVRVGRKDWPGAVCKNCGTEYVRTDGLQHVIYMDHSHTESVQEAT